MYVIGVDVGSGSVRAVLLRFEDGKIIDGERVFRATRPITTHNPAPHHYEQNTDEIWRCVRECVAQVVRDGSWDQNQVTAIGFTATCSLTIIDPEGSTKNNVIMWMDHRAVSQAKRITATGGEVTYQMGRVCSPEFSIAKLVWLKENDPERFRSARGFMELPDYLTWRALGKDSDPREFPRSVCSVVCKWGYDAEKSEWRSAFLEKFGLEEFAADPGRIGSKVVLPGVRIGELTPEMARELGIISAEDPPPTKPIAVASSLIDAHAGVLSMLTLFAGHQPDETLDGLARRVFCMIAGTSTCNMVSSPVRKCVPGIWGPYLNVIFPGYNTWEPGQSATGKLIEHIIRSHREGKDRFEKSPLDEAVTQLNRDLEIRGKTENQIHVISSFHGNRSPLANSDLRGGIYGLTLSESPLAEVYAATIEALAYDTKLIIDRLEIDDLRAVLLTGGIGKNETCCQIHADVFQTELDTVTLGDADMTLVGAGLLARQAALGADTSMDKLTDVRAPSLMVKTYKPRPETAEYHRRKYAAHLDLLQSAARVERIMKEGVESIEKFSERALS